MIEVSQQVYLVYAQGDTGACYKEPKTGPCRASLPRFFYNKTSRTCEKFIYGGCEGNENNFEDEKECKSYYFNMKTGECKPFVYGGCGGNNNNFKDEKECRRICKAK
ncbi:Kunitz/Bovine pancreatic trypsin inhibitor domain protein [Ancylostoma ceylanicum]|uniref:Kunitz/Bovine pancreatic trypsin inhibitor domain protein n=1 Tax=Ancylostoma ceylanicum TaxID=53326 RepID=A0A0D6M9J3_9BILA|nr:Kunitz/Bovine pancreatic trypsin inhibitor domain protein [Ancylostoma ceylanicum]